jgi:nucleoside-diphosphate-sugar epimerase
MKVFITGGAGYLGSVLVEKLLLYRHQVTVFDNFMWGGESLLGLDDWGLLNIVRGDVYSRTQLEAAMAGHDVVVHLAALVGDPVCKKYELEAKRTNLVGSKYVFEVARKYRIAKVIFASTCSNYGKMDRSMSEYLTEDATLNPVSNYARHKVDTESLLMNEFSDLNPTILRFATLFGVSKRMRFDLTINQFVMEALVNRKLEVYGEQFYRPYLHVRDAANCIIRLLAYPIGSTAMKIWNVGHNADNYTKKDIVEMIKDTGIGFDVEYVHKEEDPRDYRVSFSKIMRELKFIPRITVVEGIEEVKRLIELGIISDPLSDKWRNV